jgi:hypothetical protein
MKKFAAIVFLTALFTFVFSGCIQQQEQQPAEEPQEQVQQEKEMEEPQMEEEEQEDDLITQIENPENYTESDIEDLRLLPCADYPESSEFIEEAEDAGIKEYPAYDGDFIDITLYMTPNVQDVDTEEFKEIVEKCITGAGMINALKAYDDYLLWGYPYCTAGVAPNPEREPEQYEEYTECIEFQEKLTEYLDLE